MGMICKECKGLIPDVGLRTGCENHVQIKEYVRY
jgi:hypothetical protein